MAASGQDTGDGNVWDGYSDYKTVSSRIGENIFDAMDAFARVHRAHIEGERVRSGDAADASSRILSAAMSLMVELDNQREYNDEIGRIYDRWRNGRGGASTDVDVPEEGFIDAFGNVRLTEQDPDWLYQFVIDIRRAGWELGYLKAGRHEEGEPDDIVEANAEAMFV